MLLPRNVKDVLLKTKAIENLMYRYGSLLKSYMCHLNPSKTGKGQKKMPRRRLMLKMIFFEEDPDEVLNEEDISTDVNSGVERIDFRDTEEVGTNSGCKGIFVRLIITKVI